MSATPIRALCALLLAAPLSALSAVNPRFVSIDVRMEQAVLRDTDAKHSDGRKDTTTKRVRRLRISCRLPGFTSPQAGVLEWFFIGRDPASGKFTPYASGEKATRFGDLPVIVFAEGEAQQSQKSTYQGLARVRTTSGIVPHGWVVRFVQDGKVVKVAESSGGLARYVD